MGLSVRFANSLDAEVIVGFVRGLAEYEGAPGAVELTAEVVRSQMNSAAPPFECLIAELDGHPVGFALFFRNYSTWPGRSGLYLEDLFVAQEHRRKGVGGALLKRLAEIAVERGFTRMDWAVLDWNKLAQGFYRSIGARALDQWTIWRLENESLRRFARHNRSD